MSHDMYAAWATTELAHLVIADPARWFKTPPKPASLATNALRDGRANWPVADGVLRVDTGKGYAVAVEMKRQAEGLHGTLTALGQAHAYLHRGFDAARNVPTILREVICDFTEERLRRARGRWWVG